MNTLTFILGKGFDVHQKMMNHRLENSNTKNIIFWFPEISKSKDYVLSDVELIEFSNYFIEYLNESNVIVYTHSEILFKAIQLKIAQSKIHNECVKVFCFENSEINEIKINEYGQITQGFIFWTNEELLLERMKLNLEAEKLNHDKKSIAENK